MTSQASPIQPALFDFLAELEQNNDREWFAANKTRYESDVRDPAVAWIEQWVRPLSRTAPMLDVIPSRTRGSLRRIYRDTRFSKDKRPYKHNVGISLRHQADGDIHAPGVYVQLSCTECFVAAGSWRPPRESLAAFRRMIDEDPRAWKRARDHKAFRESFDLAGESLKTSPRDYSKDHPLIEDLRRIDFIALAPMSRTEVTSPGATDRVVELIRAARPWMRFLCEATGHPY